MIQINAESSTICAGAISRGMNDNIRKNQNLLNETNLIILIF